MTTETKRFWFRNSPCYMKGPYTLVGVLATSWEDALTKVCGFGAIPEAAKLLCIKDCGPYPPYYFLSCNVEQLQALEDEDMGIPVSVSTTDGMRGCQVFWLDCA